ncbi:phytochrome interacting factor 3-like 6 [Striga asiatica]|uniref:Phytochrome interacting factor 3-like 6 n=1 Tax=Striga asiatica TaxID=4170 RepID=A0A5A7R581_STRAF|nr:phytochrome interacting factor 3-like 6 [Striga asiatica]
MASSSASGNPRFPVHEGKGNGSNCAPPNASNSVFPLSLGTLTMGTVKILFQCEASRAFSRQLEISGAEAFREGLVSGHSTACDTVRQTSSAVQFLEILVWTKAREDFPIVRSVLFPLQFQPVDKRLLVQHGFLSLGQIWYIPHFPELPNPTPYVLSHGKYGQALKIDQFSKLGWHSTKLPRVQMKVPKAHHVLHAGRQLKCFKWSIESGNSSSPARLKSSTLKTFNLRKKSYGTCVPEVVFLPPCIITRKVRKFSYHRSDPERIASCRQANEKWRVFLEIVSVRMRSSSSSTRKHERHDTAWAIQWMVSCIV